MSTPDRFVFARDFLLGGLAAGISKTAVSPIERLKASIPSYSIVDQPSLIKLYFDTFRRVVQEQGVLCLWKGNVKNVIFYLPTQTLNFAFKDQFKRMLAVEANAPFWKTLGANVALGGAAGVSSLLIVYSLDVARVRSANKRKFDGILDVYRKTLAADGIAGLYRGFVLSCVGTVIYRSVYFGLFDSLKPLLPVQLKDTFSAKFLLAWAVTITACLASEPVDTVRFHMMMASGQAVKYENPLDCFMKIVRYHGASSLFQAGSFTTVLRAMTGAGVLAGYDQLQFLFGKPSGVSSA